MPLGLATAAMLLKILLGYPCAPFRPNLSSFPGDTLDNVFHHRYNIGVKPISFLPTIIMLGAQFLCSN